jgi:hypothetical protein
MRPFPGNSLRNFGAKQSRDGACLYLNQLWMQNRVTELFWGRSHPD